MVIGFSTKKLTAKNSVQKIFRSILQNLRTYIVPANTKEGKEIFPFFITANPSARSQKKGKELSRELKQVLIAQAKVKVSVLER